MIKTFILALLYFISPLAFTAESDMPMTIQQVKEKHQAELMTLPGVVSVGIGLSEDEKVIIIGLDGKHPEAVKKLPSKLDDYRVITQIVGTIKTQ